MDPDTTSPFRPIDVTGEKPLGGIDQPLPVLEWIPISKLVVDDRYQRPLTRNGWITIRKIASDFQWARFSPVLVAPLPDDRFAVIDGQHRVHAAAMRGIEMVPCMTVKIGLDQQATAFVGINDVITRVSTHQVFKAALAAGEDWALRSIEAVESADCRLMTFNKSSAHKLCGEVFCIGLIRKLVTSGNGWAVSQALLALKEIDDDRRVALYSDYILRPLMTALTTKARFCRIHLGAVLAEHDPFTTLERARDDDGQLTATAAREAFVNLLTRHQV